MQYAGEYILQECKLVSTSGIEFDLFELVADIVIFESIHDHCVTGSISFKDSTNITKIAPIIGEEKLKLKLISPQEKPTDETIINYTKNPLNIYKISSEERMNEKTLMPRLAFTSQEAYHNATTRVSRSYSDTCSNIVTKIFRDEKYLRSKKKLTVEETIGLKRLVVPSMKPFKTIEMLSRQSNSKNHKSSPTYFFYETTKGFHYRSIDGLCSEDAVFAFQENIPDNLPDGTSKDPIGTLQTIESYQILAPRDTIKNTTSGAFCSELIRHDLYSKTVDTSNYDYNAQFTKDTHLDKFPIASASTDKYTNKTLFNHYNAKRFVQTTTMGFAHEDDAVTSKNYPYQDDNAPEVLQRRASRMRLLEDAITLNITVPGNTSIQAGDVVELDIERNSTLTDKEQDKIYSGKYLITAIRHNFNQTSDEPRHVINMTVVRDSVGQPYYNTSIEYENKGSSETIVL